MRNENENKDMSQQKNILLIGCQITGLIDKKSYKKQKKIIPKKKLLSIINKTKNP